jgi:hypothetical protein
MRYRRLRAGARGRNRRARVGELDAERGRDHRGRKTRAIAQVRRVVVWSSNADVRLSDQMEIHGDGKGDKSHKFDQSLDFPWPFGCQGTAVRTALDSWLNPSSDNVHWAFRAFIQHGLRNGSNINCPLSPSSPEWEGMWAQAIRAALIATLGNEAVAYGTVTKYLHTARFELTKVPSKPDACALHVTSTTPTGLSR